MLLKMTMIALAGFVYPAVADIIKATSDIDYQFNGAQYPNWSVDVYTNANGEHRQTCSGAVVTPYIIISAARCFWGPQGLLPASIFTIARTFGGALNGRSWEYLDKSDVNAIYIPPTFRGAAGLYADDIAVVFLKTPLQGPDVVPICVSYDENLDRQQLSQGNYGRNMGYLQLAGHGLPSPLFTALEVPYVSRWWCASQSDSFFRERLTPDKICTGYKPGPGGARESLICRGDQGSGLAFYSGRGTVAVPYLRGVASTPFPEADGPTVTGCATYRFAAFTRIVSQRNFLERIVPGLEAKCAEYYPVTTTSECVCNCD